MADKKQKYIVLTAGLDLDKNGDPAKPEQRVEIGDTIMLTAHRAAGRVGKVRLAGETDEKAKGASEARDKAFEALTAERDELAARVVELDAELAVRVADLEAELAEARKPATQVKPITPQAPK